MRHEAAAGAVTAFYPGDELFLSFPFSLKYQFTFIKKLLPSSPEKEEKKKKKRTTTLI